jgi:uncharacterized membrane protein YfcA
MDHSSGSVVLLLIVGLAVGVVGGMLGIGGGILVIPALVAMFHFTHEKAVGTSLGMLLPPIGIFAFIDYYKHGNVDVSAAGMLAIGFAIGALLGARAVNTQLIPTGALRLLFAFFLLYVAGSIIFTRSDHRVWAVVKTGALLVSVAAAYGILRIVGRKMEKRFSPRDTFLSGLQEPLAPDYEI